MRDGAESGRRIGSPGTMDVRSTRLDGPHRLSREGDPGMVDFVVSSVDVLAKEECYEF